MDTNTTRKQIHKAAKRHHCKVPKNFINFLTSEIYQTVKYFLLLHNYYLTDILFLKIPCQITGIL